MKKTKIQIQNDEKTELVGKDEKTRGIHQRLLQDIYKIYEKTGCQSWRPVCVCVYIICGTQEAKRERERELGMASCTGASTNFKDVECRSWKLNSPIFFLRSYFPRQKTVPFLHILCLSRCGLYLNRQLLIGYQHKPPPKGILSTTFCTASLTIFLALCYKRTYIKPSRRVDHQTVMTNLSHSENFLYLVAILYILVGVCNIA